jgi:hypothetical protein
MAITIRPLTSADATVLTPLFGAYLDFYGVLRQPALEQAFLNKQLASSHSTVRDLRP